jgi:hypothetical protein
MTTNTAEKTVIVETVKATKKGPVVKAKRNGYGKPVKFGAVVYKSIDAFNEQFAKKHGVDPKKSYHTVIQRFNNGWTPQEILKEPIREMTSELAAAAAKSGISYQVLYNRVSKGMTLEAAMATPVRSYSPRKPKVAVESKMVENVLVETVSVATEETQTEPEPIVETATEPTVSVEEPETLVENMVYDIP